MVVLLPIQLAVEIAILFIKKEKKMKAAKMLTILVLALGLMVCLANVSEAALMGTAFTYQGHLYDNNDVANSEYDFQFKLWTDPCNTQPLFKLGDDVNKPEVDVIDGYFTVELDFGSVFDGNAIWLQIGVRPGDSTGSFTILSPRQQVTPAPYAFHSDRAKSALQLIHDFVVASGQSVSAGDVVALINNKIKKGSREYDFFGPQVIFDSTATSDISSTTLSDTKFVVAYRDGGNSGYGTVVVGEVSGNVITFGPQVVFNSATTYDISAAAFSDTKFVVSYRDLGNSSFGTAIVGEVSENVITFGPQVVFNSASTGFISAAALSDTKFVVAYRDSGNSNYGMSVVGEVSGNVITFGPEYVFSYTTSEYIYAAGLSDTKFVVAYRNGGNSYYGTAVVGEVSGNVITFGPQVVFNSARTDYISTDALSDTKFVVAYSDFGNSYYGTAVVGEVSGNVITFGPEYVFSYTTSGYISAAGLSDTKFIVAYSDFGNSYYGTAVVCEVSGNVITFGPQVVFNSARTDHISTNALPDTKFVAAYSDFENSYYGTAVMGEVPGVLMGIADAAASGGESVPVIIHGISDHHSGLVPGLLYYAGPDGSLTAEWTSTKIGIAVSPTELLLDIER